MKKLIPALAILSLLSAFPAQADEKPMLSLSGQTAIKYRRTLFVPFGQTMLMFEAPLNMCFLDETYSSESRFADTLRRKAQKQGGKIFMAAFTDCLQLSSMGSVPAAGLPVQGEILWINPAVGEKTDMARGDYLDMREATLAGDLTKDMAGKKYKLKLDPAARRAENAVLLGFKMEKEVEFETYTTEGVAAATQIRGFPVDVVMTFTAKQPEKDRQEIYGLMEKFMAQQVALNENKN